jgi:Ni,Fe-hydrogenase I cytochrome b subunit
MAAAWRKSNMWNFIILFFLLHIFRAIISKRMERKGNVPPMGGVKKD